MASLPVSLCVQGRQYFELGSVFGQLLHFTFDGQFFEMSSNLQNQI